MNAISSKWAKRCAAKILSGELSEGDIRAMRRILANSCREGVYGHRPSKQATKSEAYALIELVEQHKPRVSATQAAKGADWLFNAVFTPTGRERGTDLAREFNAADREVIKQLRDNPHFTLQTLEDVGRNGWTVFVPVYNAIGLDSFFRYAAVAWQTGGRSFVTKHA